jgi:hypothetical protein
MQAEADVRIAIPDGMRSEYFADDLCCLLWHRIRDAIRIVDVADADHSLPMHSTWPDTFLGMNKSIGRSFFLALRLPTPPLNLGTVITVKVSVEDEVDAVCVAETVFPLAPALEAVPEETEAVCVTEPDAVSFSELVVED